MHAREHAHVRRRLGLAAIAVITAIAATPAQGTPRTENRTPDAATAFAPNKAGKKRHGVRARWVAAIQWREMKHRRPTTAEIVLARARAQLGKPYVYGASGPRSFDCSGFTQFVWAGAGVRLPHNAAAQYASTRRVPLKQMRPGDLVFSSGLGHVGIYVGGGKMIHAPQSGDRVKISPLNPSTMGAGRPSR